MLQSNQVSLKDKHLMISIPTYDGKVPVDWINRFIELYKLKTDYGFKVSLHHYSNGALITNVRNIAAQEFINSPATHLLFIDADILFQPEDIVNQLALCSLPEYDLVAGVYPLKQDTPQFQLEAISEFPDDLGLIEIKGIGTGFMMIKREVIEKLIKAYPDLEYDYKGKPHWALFHQIILDNKYKGEDISFCHRWRAIGGRMWADPSIKLKHIGTKVYDYNMIEMMKTHDIIDNLSATNKYVDGQR